MTDNKSSDTQLHWARVYYLCLCELWLLSDRASCSASASWEPYLVTSPGFLAARDVGILAAQVSTKQHV